MRLGAASLEALRTRNECGIEGGGPNLAERLGMPVTAAVNLVVA
jgi:hypothetical protein